MSWRLKGDAPSLSSRTWAKLREWLRRYGLAECAGVAGALVGSVVVRWATGNAVAAAYGAAWGESVGYASVMITRDLLAETRVARRHHRALTFRAARRVVMGLLAEFGPAGVLDTFVTRPLAMGLGTRLLGLPFGVVAGKAVADILFYILVIFMYERRQRGRERDTES